MSQEEFRNYIERVFRLHNQTANQVMMLLADFEGSESEQLDRISRLESDMMKSCETLNRVVASRMQRRKGPGLLTLHSLPGEVADCHRATLAVKRALP